LRFPYKEKEIKHIPEEIRQDECTHLLLELCLVCTPLLQVMTFKSIISREDEKGRYCHSSKQLLNQRAYVQKCIPTNSIRISGERMYQKHKDH
jgi:hypothetical protein